MKSYASILKPQAQAQESGVASAQSGTVATQSPLARAAAGCATTNGLKRPPGYLVQNLFLPTQNTFSDTFLTPESKKQADKPGELSPVNFSAEKRDLVFRMGLANLQAVPARIKSTAARNLAYQNFQASAMGATSHGELHSLAAEDADLLRTFSASLLEQKNAIPIQKFSVQNLNEPVHAAAAADFMQAMQHLTGKVFDQPQQYWPYMTGAGAAAGKNHLLTVVDIEDVGQLRFMSVSGLNRFQVDAANHTLSIPVGGRKSSLGSIQCNALPKSKDRNKCTVEANADQVAAHPKNAGPIHYLGYNDIVIGSGHTMKEARLLPRTKTLRPDGDFHDRARDTEYVVLSGLRMLMRAKPGWVGKPMSIAMYSRLPMCPACQNAASHAILSAEFSQLKSFAVYAGN